MRNLYFSGTICGEFLCLQQVQKRTAEKLFNNGQRVFIQSSNFRPFNVWADALELTPGESFNDIVNSFRFYNCCNCETGKYVTFYKIAL